MVRIPGVVPDPGLTESHSGAEVDAVNDTGCPDETRVAVWTAGVVAPTGAISVTNCGFSDTGETLTWASTGIVQKTPAIVNQKERPCSTCLS
jgi:hypothetical protein